MTTESRPAALDWSTENCTIAAAMRILGERSTLAVLREVFNGVRRFDDIRSHAHLPRQVLTNRLAMLVDAEILRRVPYRVDGARTRYEYRLTDKGLDLYPVLAAVKAWGDRYLAGPGGPPMELSHRDCGAPTEVHLDCTAGHRLRPRDVAPRPGPGATRLSVAAPE